MYLENVGEDAILDAIDEMAARYARERQPQEHFGVSPFGLAMSRKLSQVANSMTD